MLVHAVHGYRMNPLSLDMVEIYSLRDMTEVMMKKCAHPVCTC